MEASQKELKLFHLTWPIFLELFLFMLMGIADTFMLSALSDDAVSGVGAANQFIQIAILILGVVGAGAGIVVSQYLGSQRFEEATKISALSITLNLMIGCGIGLGFLLSAKPLMVLMNLQGDVLHFAQTYLKIVGGTIFLQAIITSLSAIIRVNGKTMHTMYVSLVMNIIHLVLNYLLIFGKFGFPSLGVEGAALSSAISRVAAIVILFYLFYRVLVVKMRMHYYYTLSKEYISKILKIGIPAALEEILYHVCQVIFLYYVTYLGTESLAARQYAMNISTIMYLCATAIGMGTAILVGRFVGAGEQTKAYDTVWKSVKAALIFTIFIVAIVTLLREPIIGLFTDDPNVIHTASSVLVFSMFLETGRTINITIINSLRASGDSRFPVKIGFLSMLCMSVPLGYVLVFVFDLGLLGVWLAVTTDEWVRAIIVLYRWKSKHWQRYAIITPKQ